MENLNHMIYANHSVLWLICSVGIIIVLIQSALIIKKSIQAGKDMGIPKERMNRGIKTAAIASIGPALGVVGSLLALLVTMGSPISALRLSVIGGDRKSVV